MSAVEPEEEDQPWRLPDPNAMGCEGSATVDEFASGGAVWTKASAEILVEGIAVAKVSRSKEKGCGNAPGVAGASRPPPLSRGGSGSGFGPAFCCTPTTAPTSPRDTLREAPRCCPQGHELRACTGHEGGTCDGCGKGLSPGALVAFCRRCNWDLCVECYSEANLFDASTMTAAKDADFVEVAPIQVRGEPERTENVQCLCCA